MRRVYPAGAGEVSVGSRRPIARDKRVGLDIVSLVGSISDARLDEMVTTATVDCYNYDEQVTGLYTLTEENREVPFETQVLGEAVTV